MPVFHLVYRSTASPTLEFKDLEDILLLSRIRNQRDGITGLLIYRDHAFVQLIEGDEPRVRALLERIRADRRHFGLEVLTEVASPERMMSKWSMGWVDGQRVGLSSQQMFQLFDLTWDDRELQTPASSLEFLRRFAQDAQLLMAE